MPAPPPRPLVIGLGEILWDLLPGGKQLGGAPANFAYHAKVLGADARVVSSVGRDALGSEILERLCALGLETRHVPAHPSAPTGTVDVRVDERGVPRYVIHENVAWDAIPWSESLRDLAPRADAVCFGSLAQRSETSRQTVRRFLDATRDDCLRIFDINLRQSYYSAEVLEQSLQRSTVLKLNDQELPVLVRMFDTPADEERAIAALARRFALTVVALTRGEQGSRLYADGRFLDHAGRPTRVIDTVGAGDAFTAALALGLLRDEPAELWHDRANRLASFVCSKTGATPPVPAEVVA